MIKTKSSSKLWQTHLRKIMKQTIYRTTWPMLNQVEMNLKGHLIWTFQHRLRKNKVIFRKKILRSCGKMKYFAELLPN